ncbi:MAG TPA: hypothetical protein VJ201_07110 [Candidatus Babeliales bacterium]|nr:hypothetical protein [Candidatus Babeliales bacterium]
MKNSLLLILITLSIGSTVYAKDATAIDCHKYCTDLSMDWFSTKTTSDSTTSDLTTCLCTSTLLKSCTDFNSREAKKACKAFCKGVASCGPATNAMDAGTAAASICTCPNN